MRMILVLAAKRPNVPDVIPIFITLDPHRDSCAQVGAYAKDFHPRMVGLTGTPGQVAKIAKAFRVYFADVDRKEDDDEYLGRYGFDRASKR
jgi:cytochrome oxidase Cu insertion factor (SCO1/SenC/PrrC family)